MYKPVEMGSGYTFFRSGLPKDARRIHGVGFAVRTTGGRGRRLRFRAMTILMVQRISMKH